MIRNSSPSDVAFYSALAQNGIKKADICPPHYMVFTDNNGEEIGRLDFTGEKITFKGNAEKSAKVFFDWAIRLFEEEIKKRVCSEIQKNPTKYALECEKF